MEPRELYREEISAAALVLVPLPAGSFFSLALGVAARGEFGLGMVHFHLGRLCGGQRRAALIVVNKQIAARRQFVFAVCALFQSCPQVLSSRFAANL